MIKISNKHNLKMNASFRYYLMYICLIITLNAGRNFVFICKISNEKNPEKEHITVIQFYLILKSNKKLSQNRLSDLHFCKSLRKMQCYSIIFCTEISSNNLNVYFLSFILYDYLKDVYKIRLSKTGLKDTF